MFDTVRAILPDTPTVVHECRKCGYTVDRETERCPACGASGIAHYTVD